MRFSAASSGGKPLWNTAGFAYKQAWGQWLSKTNPTIRGNAKGILSGGMDAYSMIKDFAAMTYARQYFTEHNRREHYNAWNENKFVEIVCAISENKLAKPLDQDKILPPNPHNKNIIHVSAFGNDLKKMQDEGMQALGNGELFVLDLAAGMAKGFGGATKAIIEARRDESARYPIKKDFIDIKREDYWHMQQQVKRHIIAGVMVSEDTEKDVEENLRQFAIRNNLELVLIYPSMSKEEIDNIWQAKKNNWDKCIIVPILRQPAMLSVSEDLSVVGKAYMSGPGNVFDVVKHQARDMFEVFGFKYCFTSNIDNTAALVSRRNIGFFISEVRNNGLQAMAEFSQKIDADRAGVLIEYDGELMVMEPNLVPDKLKDAALGKERFQYAHNNSIWWTKEAFMDRDVDLPLYRTGMIDNATLKIESTVSEGLKGLNWKALVVDRGTRFLPIKTLFDLWRGRTDCVELHHGRARWAMENGEIIDIPVGYVSPSVISTVADVENNIHLGGSRDSMRNLKSLYIGNDPGYFDDNSRKLPFKTNCAVTYEGNVVIIYERVEGQAPGSLIISGKNEGDRIKLKDCVIFVPAGKPTPISRSKDGEISPRVTKEMLEATIAKVPSWTESRKQTIVNELFKGSEKLPTIDQYISQDYLSHMTVISREQLIALKELLQIKGVLDYDAQIEGENVKVKVRKESRKGIAKTYNSLAEKDFVTASPRMEIAVKTGKRIVLKTRGGGIVSVGLPIKEGKKIKLVTLLGELNESAPAERKLVLLAGKLAEVKRIIAEKTPAITPQAVEEAFIRLKWIQLLEHSATDIAHILIEDLSRNNA